MRMSSDRTAGIFWGAENDEEACPAARGDPCLPFPANAGSGLSSDGHEPDSRDRQRVGNPRASPGWAGAESAWREAADEGRLLCGSEWQAPDLQLAPSH